MVHIQIKIYHPTSIEPTFGVFRSNISQSLFHFLGEYTTLLGSRRAGNRRVITKAYLGWLDFCQTAIKRKPFHCNVYEMVKKGGDLVVPSEDKTHSSS